MTNIADFLTAGIFVVDEDLNIIYWNKWLTMQTHIKEEDAIGKRLGEVFPYINEPTLRRKVKTCISLNANTFFNPPEGYLIKIKNERVIETLLEYSYQTVKIVPYDQEKRHALIIIDDQTAIKEAYLKVEKLKNEAENYLEIIDKHVCTLITDENGIIMSASTAMLKLVGYEETELVGKNPNILRHPDTSKNIFKQLWTTLQSGGVWRGEYKNINKYGEEYWVRSIIFPIPNSKTIRYQAIMEDVSDKKKLEAISITDELTGLYNRRHFNSLFAIDLQKAKAKKCKFIFLMFDVDHFKGYNDYYGHQKGDVVLSSIAKALSTTVAEHGECFRLGGEEFGVITGGMDSKSCSEFAEKIRAAIESLGIENIRNSASSFVTASIGIYLVDFSDKNIGSVDAKMIYARADEALYKAKASGRNQFVFWSP